MFEVNIRFSTLDHANLERVNLSYSKIFKTNFAWTNLKSALLIITDFEDVNLSGAQIVGEPKSPIDTFSVFHVDLTYTALRYVNIYVKEKLNYGLYKIHGDGSVKIFPVYNRPLHWCMSVLSEDEYYARWRGLIESDNGHGINNTDYVEFADPSNTVIPVSIPCPSMRRDE